MRLLDRLLAPPAAVERDLTVSDYYDQFLKFGGWQYPVTGNTYGEGERLEHSFPGYVDSALKSNGIVFACVAARLELFSQAEFAFRNTDSGKIFGTPALGRLEKPGPNRTTQEVLALCELDASFAGNSYWVRDGSGVRRLRPDWVGIVTGDVDKGQRSSDLLGYTYTDGGPKANRKPETFLPGEVAHFSPIPDPTAHHRGMSWITPLVRDIQADTEFTKHRLSLSKKGAVHTMAVSYPPLSEDQFKVAVKSFRDLYEGPDSSGRTIHVSGGADITPMSMDLRSLDFKNVQGGGETRIAAAARVPAVIAGISEGLAGSSLNQGNYQSARRQFGDLFGQPAWMSVCGAFENLVDVPQGPIVLWFKDGHISFLRDDQRDAAEVIRLQMEAIRNGVDAGYRPDAVVEAVQSLDVSKLTAAHSGLFSVQLQPAGTGGDANEPGEPATTTN